MPSRIVVVEDDIDLLQLCTIALRRGGHDVIGCGSAEDALEHLPTADLILLDIRLPGRSGLDILRDERPHAPVIVMSAHADQETASEARALGARDFIGKPFNPLDLMDLVAAHLVDGSPDG